MSNNADVGKVFNIMSGTGGGDGSLRLESLAVTKPPNKTTYKSGETFDPTGMVVTGSYAFGLTSDVTGYTVSPSVLTDGVSEVTITYTEGRVTKTASTPVTVEKVLTAIEVTTPPTKTSYNYLESFDPAGMVVTAKFSDGSSAPATGYTYPDTAFSTLGSQPVNIGYTYEGVSRETTLSVTVNAISVPIPTQDGTISYTGLEQTPTWNNFDSVKMAVTGDTSGVNAKDNYSVTFTLVYGYVFPDGKNEATVKWAINRAVIEALPTQKDIPAADGGVKSPSWDGYDPVKMTIGADRSGTAAGDYTATFTPTPNYQWWDGTTGAKSVTWSIASVIVPIPTQKNIPTYDGANKTPEWDDFDTDHCTVTVTPAVNAGEYSATFSLLEGLWEDGTTGDKTVKWRINRAILAKVPEQSGTPVYDGNPKTPTWDTSYESAKMTVSVEAKTLAGTDYPAEFTPTPNYQWWDGTTDAKSATWSIARATITTVPSQNGTLTYTGSEQTVSLKNFDSNKLTLGGTTKGTNAGEYSANVTPTPNYQWSDGTTTAKTVKWNIGKAAGSLSLSASAVTLNRTNLSKTVTATRAGDGVISVTSSNTSVATATVSGTTITINHVNQASGTATITVKVAAGTNHEAPSNKTITVTAQFTTIYGVEWDWTSSGPTKGTRTDAAAGFGDPNPAVNNGTGSSPFDNLMPWAGMVKETRAGGVEVKEPKYWFKWTKTGKKLKLQIADGPVEGFHVDPVNMDRGDGLGELDFSYIGRYHCTSDNWKSETNKAQKCSITRSAARSGIHGLGANFWQIDFAQFWYVGMLFLVEFADWNGERIGRGCSASGSKENNGKTDAMQYHTGTTAANRDTYGFTQYRNIEGWWDNVYDWMDGCYYNSNGLNVIKNPNQFSDSANGVLVGKPTDGYPSDFAIPTQSGLEWALYPIAKAGSQTTYVPDYWNFYGSNPCLFHGGSYFQNQNHGPFYVIYYSASSSSDYIGCRLQERPPKAA